MSGSRSLGLASVLRGVVCMVTSCLNRTNFPSSLSSRFGRFCCGGVEKDEEPAVDQPGFNCAAVDPWSYVGPVMEPQNGRLVFRKGMWSQQEDAVPAFSQQPSPPGSEHHSWSTKGSSCATVDSWSNARPATEPDQPEFGRSKWWGGAPVEASDTRKYRCVGGFLRPIWSDDSLYPESSNSGDEAEAGCQPSRAVSCGDLRQDPRVELRRTKSLLPVFPKDFKVGVFFY
ncbi:hypothetical protein JTE90_005224 [Oedothorax gibbosus]|uniref:Uncharacterized protein n=1 Tax=Oedothorax gibbosus TaxID=931172 RepID=A0AAV6ULL9_9ARAC|nr:hypothetical protein JTE90_005224 [Oedothorax gibbosus]